ncbi:hypothetical protein C8F04DRAFT_1184545 [Mycena alexandri]|uniref:Uncharacterized protein n=1 Tax=Mycena alexandri TaxID=1745969 RepID=A0AAD6X5H5_9AGAR|nr:hypothetical protein C8F04DRAFT_1184545 [Mycena alexandri]
MSYQGCPSPHVKGIHSPSISVDPGAPPSVPVQKNLTIKFKKPSTTAGHPVAVPSVSAIHTASSTPTTPSSGLLQTTDRLPTSNSSADMALFMQFMEWKNAMAQSGNSTPVKRKASVTAPETPDLQVQPAPSVGDSYSPKPGPDNQEAPSSQNATLSSTASPSRFKPSATVSGRATKKVKVEDSLARFEEDSLEFRRITSLPSVCEVYDVELQDPHLKDDYMNLYNLRKASIESWSQAVGPGNVLPTMWDDVSKDYDGPSFLRLLSFQSKGQYVNLARVDPTCISAVRDTKGLGKARDTWTLCVNDRTAICLSPVMVTQSSVTKIGRVGQSDAGLQLKFITGILHAYEFDRTVAVIGMAFQQHKFNAQIHADSITFGTKPVSESKNKSLTKPHSKFVGVQSSSARASGNSRTQSDETLSVDDNVPVYDLRDMDFDPYEHIESIAHLPPYIGEIPENSLAVVGYTVNHYNNSKGHPAVAFNLRWKTCRQNSIRFWITVASYRLRGLINFILYKRTTCAFVNTTMRQFPVACITSLFLVTSFTKLMRARRIKSCRVFLDLEARTSDNDEEDEEDFEDDSGGFLDRRAFADDLRPRPVAIAMLDDVGLSPEEEVDAIRLRYKERVARESGYETDFFAPFDRQIHHCSRYDAGSVYVETADPAAVNYLHARVAFVLQNFQPERVPVEDYVSLLSCKSPALMSSKSWARIKRKGPYCGSLGWIEHADRYKCCYEIWLVPIAADDDSEEFALFRRCHLLDGTSSSLLDAELYGGLVVAQHVPLYAVIETDACPTLRELEDFSMRLPSNSGQAPYGGEDLFEALKTSISLLQHTCRCIRGDQVHVIAGSLSGCIGTVKIADARFLTLQLLHPTDAVEEVERSDVVYHLSPGELVEIVHGPRAALRCWIVSVDWQRRLASVVAHTFTTYTGPEGPYYIPLTAELNEFDIELAFLKPTPHAFSTPQLSVIGPPSANKNKLSQTPDQLAGIEVRIGGKNKLSGVFGTIVASSRDYKSASVLTEGRAENVKVKIPLDQLRERHTGKTLKDYVDLPGPVRLAIRRDRERRWADLLDPTLEEAIFHGAMEGSWNDPSVAIDRRDLFPELYSSSAAITAPPAHAANSSDAGSSSRSMPDYAPLTAPTKRNTTTSDPTRSLDNYGLPGGQLPGLWLTQPALRGLTVDVVIHNSQRSHNGKYEGKIGTLTIPTDKKISMGNRDNSLMVNVITSTSAVRPFKLWHIFPLTTTEFDGHVRRENAISILDALSTWVVIIGPDRRGNSDHVGKLGQISLGGFVVVNNEQWLDIDITSLCRSDPIPRFKPTIGPILTEEEKERRERLRAAIENGSF